MLLVLARKKPVGWMIRSTSARSAAASSAGPGYAAKSSGVVRLTRTSVVWAESTVAMSSSHGERKSSSAWA